MPTTRSTSNEPGDGRWLPSIAALPLSADLKRILTDLLLALGADADFVGDPSLARLLRDCLEGADRFGLPQPNLRQPYRKALSRLLAVPPSRLPAIPPEAPGRAARYPVLRALQCEVPSDASDRALRLRALLVYVALLHQHTVLPPVVAVAAKELRLSFRPGDRRGEVLARIPQLASGRLPLDGLVSTTEALRAQRGLSTQQRQCLTALVDLARLGISATIAAERRAPTPLTEVLVELGDGWIEQVRGPDEAVFETAADPPDEPFWTFRERPVHDPVSVRGLAAAARRSGFALTATTRALPWDSAVLSPIQLDVVLASLHAKASSPEDAPERWCGTLLALLLATGLALEELAALELGEGRQLDPTAGVYRRSPPVTAARSHSPRETRQERLPPGAVLELPLPEPVRALLPRTATGPLGDWLAGASPPSCSLSMSARLAMSATRARYTWTPSDSSRQGRTSPLSKRTTGLRSRGSYQARVTPGVALARVSITAEARKRSGSPS